MATTNSKEMKKELLSIGDRAKSTYEDSKDLKAALVAIKAYSEVTRLSVAQIQHKKLTGFPSKIEFLEEN